MVGKYGVNVLIVRDSTGTNAPIDEYYKQAASHTVNFDLHPDGDHGTYTFASLPGLQHSTQANTDDSFIRWVFNGFNNPEAWKTPYP